MTAPDPTCALARYRRRMTRLGTANAVMAILFGVAAYRMRDRDLPVPMTLAGLGVLLAALAALAIARRSRAAAVVSLALHAVFALGNLARSNVQGLVVFGVCIALAAQALRLERTLRA